MSINDLFTTERVIKDISLMDSICEILVGDDDEDNAFENEPYKTAEFDSFATRYIDTIEDGETQDNAFSDFVSAITEARHVAFALGFKTAIKLLTEL